MEIITSKTNQKIVEAKKLLEKKYRDQTGLFLAETKKVILEAISSGLTPKYAFVLQGKDVSIFEAKTTIYYVNESVFKALSSTVSGDGYIKI